MEQVYIFDFGDKLKIGYSTNVNQRLSTIESASGAKVKQTYAINGTRKIEQAALYYLWKYHIHGEYFSCDFETAKQALDRIASGEIIIPEGAKTSAARKRAVKKAQSKCDAIMLRPSKEEGTAIRAAATAAGQSNQQYILQAVRERMNREDAGE